MIRLVAVAMAMMLAGPTVAAERARAAARSEPTRLMVDIGQPAGVSAQLAEDGLRVTVALTAEEWDSNRANLKAQGLIRRFDFIPRGSKRGLLVAHLAVPVRIEHQFTLAPDAEEGRASRLVVVLAPAAPAKGKATDAARSEPPQPVPAPPVAVIETDLPPVVIPPPPPPVAQPAPVFQVPIRTR